MERGFWVQTKFLSLGENFWLWTGLDKAIKRVRSTTKESVLENLSILRVSLPTRESVRDKIYEQDTGRPLGSQLQGKICYLRSQFFNLNLSLESVFKMCRDS